MKSIINHYAKKEIDYKSALRLLLIQSTADTMDQLILFVGSVRRLATRPGHMPLEEFKLLCEDHANSEFLDDAQREESLRWLRQIAARNSAAYTVMLTKTIVK